MLMSHFLWLALFFKLLANTFLNRLINCNRCNLDKPLFVVRRFILILF
jgi:hypothetical protein